MGKKEWMNNRKTNELMKFYGTSTAMVILSKDLPLQYSWLVNSRPAVLPVRVVYLCTHVYCVY